MKKRDAVSSLFWLITGILFCGGAIKYEIVRSGIPGPGFLPFLAGMILVFLSLMVLIPSVIFKISNEKKTEEKFFVEKGSWRKILLSLLGLCVYAAFLPYLGFPIVTFLFMILSLRFVARQRLITTFTTAFLTMLLSYVLFEVLLEIHLPKGIFHVLPGFYWN